MKSVESFCAVILEAGGAGKISPQLREAGFAFVKNRRSEKSMPFDIENNFRAVAPFVRKSC